MNAAEEVLKKLSESKADEKDGAGIGAAAGEMSQKIKNITLVAVTKDDKHKAKSILRSDIFKGPLPEEMGKMGEAGGLENAGDAVFDDGDIISINQECHRFAIAAHRKRRSLSRGL